MEGTEKPERRRSDRVKLTMPLRVQGKDENGAAFDTEGHTLILSRHGACIHSTHRLRYGQIISLFCPATMRRGGFRVVGPIEPMTEAGGEWAVEATEADINLWGIRFPPLSPKDEAPQKALLECQQCHEAALLRVSLSEVDVLETAGIILRECSKCRSETQWVYASEQVTANAPAEDAAQFKDAVEASATPAEGANRRRFRRVPLQLPLLVRDYFGGKEVAKTENVSKSGLCFFSPNSYLLGQGLLVVCPYDPSLSSVEVRARVVRREQNAATGANVYGLRFDMERKT